VDSGKFSFVESRNTIITIKDKFEKILAGASAAFSGACK
jgi:hypothetical protein